jgi:hypothetical protein
MTLSYLVDDFLKTYWPENQYRIANRNTKAEKLLRKWYLQNKCLAADKEITADGLEKLVESIRNFITSSNNKKGTIEFYKIFCEYLAKKSLPVEINWPPVDVSNRLERLLYIVKYLQDRQDRDAIPDLENVLLTSKRTIEEDLSILRKGTEIFGRSFRADGIERHSGRIDFSSTIHPILLTPNLTQVLIMLRELKKVCDKEKAFQEYARHMAVNIWQQLSDYARERICVVSEKLMSEDAEWYKQLNETESEEYFQTEADISRRGKDVILDCLKNEKKCYIECKNEDNASVFLENCKIIKMPGDKVELESSGGFVTLALDSILRSAYTKEEIV